MWATIVRTPFICAATLSLFVAGIADEAAADTVYVTYTGTVASGSDVSTLFGSTVGANLANDPFTATFAFTVPSGTGTDPNANVIEGLSPNSPSLGASITISGVTQSIDGSEYGLIAGTSKG